VYPGSTLILANAVSFYPDYESAKRGISPDIFRAARQVSGSEVSRDIAAGFAVRNPAQVLRALPGIPAVVPGSVLAGSGTVERFRALSNLFRSDFNKK
jgi:hypothetical protein